MGVSDRVYMRDRAPSPISFGSSWTLRFIVLLAAAFVAARGAEGWFGRRVEDSLLLSAESLRAGRVWTLATAALLHADVMHLLFNALALWYFGKLVEETLGGARYLWFLALAAVLSHVPFVLEEFATGGDARTIGASGVVMAALVFAAFRYPRMPFSFWGLPVLLWQLAALYVVLDVVGVSRGGDMVDHWTHLGGVIFGFSVHKFGLFPRFSMKPLLPHGGRPPRAPGPFRGEDVQAEIDRLLDKIGRDGIGSLTEDEREFLKRNSGGYR